MSSETQLGETDNGLSYSDQRSLHNNNEDEPMKPDKGCNEAEIALSLAREDEESAILELRQDIQKMTNLTCPTPSRSLEKKMNKFEYKLERAIMKMAELGTFDEEFEFENMRQALDNNPGALVEVQKETAIPEVSRSLSID